MSFLGLFYGALIVLSYLSIKVLSGDSYLLYFASACGILFLVTLPFLRGPFPRPFKGVLIRALMYAITNFLILAAQNKGTVSSSLAAALIGSMAVSLPTLLKAPYRKKNFVIILCILLGAFLLLDQIKLSYLALVSGIIQAITFASASRVMRIHQIPIRWNLATGFGMVALVGFIVSFFMPLGEVAQLNWLNLLAICSVIGLSQIAFFRLYKNFSAESAGRFSLGRIPWGYLIDMIYLQTLMAPHTLVGVALLSVGSFMRRERRSARR